MVKSKLIEKKICPQCEKEKILKSFRHGTKNKDGSERYRSICNTCHSSNKRKRAKLDPERSKKLKAKERRSHLKRTYNITQTEYDKKFEEQDGRCANPKCRTDYNGTDRYGNDRPFCVDHNHETGEVRGLLCTNCNAMMGGAMDEVELLKGGIEYLEKYDRRFKKKA